MIKLPLRYCGQKIGSALVDDDQESLSAIPYLSIRLPQSVRKYAHHRPDIIIATLKEDSELRSRITPFLTYAKLQIRLSHLVLRMELTEIILKFPKPSHHTIQWIKSLQSEVGRVIYVNNDRTDCRMENLRELSKA